MTAASMEQTVLADGRVELSPEVDSALGVSALHNDDLAPVPIARRTWSTYNYLALWVGMAHNVATWTLAAGLIALGMAWYQAILTIMIANVLVLIPMLANSHAGTKYGIPFPVFARASFGVFGANLPALIRAGVACGWFGIQTWIGGGAIFVLVGEILGDSWLNASSISIGTGSFAAQPWTMWLSFLLFWSLNIFIIWRGMDTIRRFENWAAPFVLVVAFILLIWMAYAAGGFGPIINDPGTLGWGSDFWAVFWPALMGMIAFWSTLSLNMPDFTRFGRSQREQAVGQILGLPTTMTVFPLIAVLVTSASAVVFGGDPIWDPVQLIGKMDNILVASFALFTLTVATLSVNVAANVVSPSYDFSNAWPKRISFRTGGLITGVIGILIQPWNLYSDPHAYIFTWLGTYGGATGAIAGVLMADYWWIRRNHLHLADLYRRDGKYRYIGGWNWIGVVSLLVGILFAIGGSYSASGEPFPVDGIIPALKPLADYSWVVGLLVSFVLYGVLTLVVGNKEARKED
jgi:NCS1 family nucleobase:cation symporter-1